MLIFYPLPQGERQTRGTASPRVQAESVAPLPLPLWERIRRPGEQSEPLAEVGEGFHFPSIPPLNDPVLSLNIERELLMTPQPIPSNKIIRLSVKDQIRFAKMLANPPKPNAALKRAQEAHERLIASSE
jgi:hypothetical protein